MNSIQKYVLNSLFERKQITEEKLAQALDAISNKSAIDEFLSVLITGEITKFAVGEIESEEITTIKEEKIEDCKKLYLTANVKSSNKHLIYCIATWFGIKFNEAEKIVLKYYFNNVFTCPVSYLTTEELDDYEQERIINFFNTEKISVKFSYV